MRVTDAVACLHHHHDIAGPGVGHGGRYSHAVVSDGHVHLSGQIAADDPGPEGAAAIGDIRAETRVCLRLLAAVLAEVGLDLSDVVRVGVFMTDLAEFDAMNEAYAARFPPGRLPARTCVGVASILAGCRVEIDAVARLRAPAA